LIPTLPSEILKNEDLYYDNLNTSIAVDKSISISFKHNIISSILPGTLLNISFVVNGTNSAYFKNPDAVRITI
jgi:hypothetical protein